MKIREIIREDMSAEEQLGQGGMSTNLVSVLMFLKRRGEDKELTLTLRTDSLIQLVQNAGDVTFSYEDLVDANESDPAVQELIANLSKDEVTLRTDNDDENSDEEEADPNQNPEAVVDQMAKNAAGV